MKVISLATLSILTVLSLPSFAAYNGPDNNVSASQVGAQPDGAWITLKGKLIKRLGEDNFIFQDSTGEVTVDIDNDVWLGQDISPNDTVRIRGEVDQDWNGVSVDVSSLEREGAPTPPKGGFSGK